MSGNDRAAELYLDLLKRSLTRYAYPEQWRAVPPRSSVSRLVRRVLAARGLHLVERAAVDPARRAEGRDWPPEAETMVGLRRLDNVQRCVETVLAEKVPGDLMEAGVWRGGATILMRAVLEAYGDQTRLVWAADSFQGLPKPDAARYPQDGFDQLWTKPELAVPLEQVQANFARYGLLDDRVRFLVGWFEDTLPTAPVQELAVLRLDGDMYQSTMDALTSLYHRVVPGGFLIVDDYVVAPNCRAAIHDFREANGIVDRMTPVDWTGVVWRKS